MRSLNRVTVSRSALAHNFNLCRNLAGDAGLLALLKADGYGHGMVDCARLFAELGAAAFGVAEVVEGIALRNSGIKLPVLVLAGVMPDTLAALVKADLTPVL
jgi:alanine racemase